jgi:hypothetical protein
VRDLLAGREPHDYDVATSATPDVVLALFERTFAVGAHFGVVLIADGDEAGDGTTEVATFRSDGAYSDGRHPDAVRYTTSAEEDVKRRDFTINGLLLDPEKLFPQGLKPIACEEPDVLAEARTLQGEAITHSAQDDSSITTQHTMRSAVLCGRLDGRNSALKKTTCGCCAGCGLRRGSDLKWRRELRRRCEGWRRALME